MQVVVRAGLGLVEDRPLTVHVFGKIVGVPQSHLRYGRIEPDLEHVPVILGAVGAAAMPDAVMQHQHGAGRADHMPLTDDVLIAPYRRLADDPQVAARQEPCAAHRRGHRMRVPHQLDIERRPGVDGRILMPVLAILRPIGPASGHRRRRIGDVGEVMVDQRFGPHKALNDSHDLGLRDEGVQRRLRRIGSRERRAGIDIRQGPRADFLDVGFADFQGG